MAGQTQLPTQTDESLGRVKVEEASPDPNRWISGAEHNRIVTKLIELAGIVGLGDGTTVASLEARLKGFNAPGQLGGATEFAFVDDFESLRVATTLPWATSLTAGGTVTQ